MPVFPYQAGDVVILDFADATGVKRRPAVILSSDLYHSSRPDVIVALITSQIATATLATDAILQDWAAAGLRLPSAVRSFLYTPLQLRSWGASAGSQNEIGRLYAPVCSRRSL